MSRDVISLDISKCSGIESLAELAVTFGCPQIRAVNITSPYRTTIRCVLELFQES